MEHARDRFQQVSKYMVYYGPARDMDVRTDAVIVEPSAHHAASLQSFRDKGALVIGYTSVMEAGPHQPFWHELVESDFLHDPMGERLERPEYGNCVMDMTSEHWRGIVMYECGRLITEHYDGIFLDTIGNVEIDKLPGQASQLEACVDFVAQLRRWFPSAVLVQNNGLELLAPRTAAYIDGIVWENPPLGQKDSARWLNAVTDRLHTWNRSHGVKVFALFEGAEQMTRQQWIVAKAFADGNGFVSSFSPKHYLGAPIGEIHAR